MRHYITKTEPVRAISVLDHTTCDLCGKTTKQGDWESSSYEIDETEIEVIVRQKEGSNFPECGSGTKYIVDICPQCFKEKLIPWLESQGCTAKMEDWDW